MSVIDYVTRCGGGCTFFGGEMGLGTCFCGWWGRYASRICSEVEVYKEHYIMHVGIRCGMVGIQECYR